MFASRPVALSASMIAFSASSTACSERARCRYFASTLAGLNRRQGADEGRLVADVGLVEGRHPGRLKVGNRAASRGAGVAGKCGAWVASSRKNGTPSAAALLMKPTALSR